jgi:hypothetical protein
MSLQQRVTSSQREQMIAEAAYFRAERRGFNGGDPVRDWCEAEAEIDARLRQLEDGQFVERIEEVLESAVKKVAVVRRKVARLSREARDEWERDLDKLAILRDTLKPKLVEIKEQGERAGRKVREQAEIMRDEIADLVQRLEARTKH